MGVVATGLFWGDYQLYGHSAEMDYFRQLSFDNCVSSGIAYPRWLPDTYHGYGSPLFHFYGPLPYYITEVFVLAGFQIHTSLKIALVLALILSGLGIYLFCRDFAGHHISFIAGIAYMLAPYHLVDMVVRHAMGEHMAFAFLPFAAWGLTGIIKGKASVRMAVGAIAFAAMILTHNVSAMLAAGALTLWLAVLAFYSMNWRKIVWGVLLICVALSLAAFFWVPVMMEKGLTYADESLTQGYFVYWDHFVYPQQLFSLYWNFGGSRKGTADDTMSFQVGVPHWIFVFAAFIFLIIGFKGESKSKPLIIYGAVLFAGSVFFTLPVSEFAYKIIPLLGYIQFPWRFLLFAAFAASICAIAVEGLLLKYEKEKLIFLFSTLAGALIVIFYSHYTLPKANVFYLEQHTFSSLPLKQLDTVKTSHNIYHVWEIADLSFFRQKGEMGTSRDDYLPRTVDRAYKPGKEPMEEVTWIGPESALVTWRNRGPVSLTAEVQTDYPGTLEFARFYFPGWKASLNDKPVEIAWDEKKGTILVPVDAGRSKVELTFGSTPLRAGAGWFSFLTLLGLFAYCVLMWRKEKTDSAS